MFFLPFPLLKVVRVFHEMIEEVEMLLVTFDGNSLINAVIPGKVSRQENRRVETINLIRQMIIVLAVSSTDQNT